MLMAGLFWGTVLGLGEGLNADDGHYFYVADDPSEEGQFRDDHPSVILWLLEEDQSVDEIEIPLPVSVDFGLHAQTDNTEDHQE